MIKVCTPPRPRRRPSTGEDPEEVSRIESPGEDDPAPSTKTDPPSPSETEVQGVREDPTRGTSASSNATAGSACKDDCEEPTSPAMPGAPKAPATAERGDATMQEIAPPPTEISSPAPGQKKSWQPRYRWSYRGSLQSARERDLTSPRYSLPPGSDKARADPGRSFWPQPPRRRGPVSCPGTREDESRGSEPMQRPLQTPW